MLKRDAPGITCLTRCVPTLASGMSSLHDNEAKDTAETPPSLPLSHSGIAHPAGLLTCSSGHVAVAQPSLNVERGIVGIWSLSLSIPYRRHATMFRIADRYQWLRRLRWAAIPFHMIQPTFLLFLHSILLMLSCNPPSRVLGYSKLPPGKEAPAVMEKSEYRVSKWSIPRTSPKNSWSTNHLPPKRYVRRHMTK